MIKLVHCIARRPGLSPTDFSDYWDHVHGPIGRRIAGLRRLVQSHAIDQSVGSPKPAFDGVVELWFDDLAALKAARRSPEWWRSTEDQANFSTRHGVSSS